MTTNISIFERKIGNTRVNAVNARELYDGLEVKSDFKNWIKNRIEDTQAEENYDYFCFVGKILPTNENADNKDILVKNLEENESKKFWEYSNKNRPIDYIITLDLAKEFAMLEKNKNGKKIRKYFIEFEKMGIATITHLRKEIKMLNLRIAESESEITKLNNLLEESHKVMDKYLKMFEAKNIQKQIDKLLKRKEELIQEGYHVE